jgi:hypothetical protein
MHDTIATLATIPSRRTFAHKALLSLHSQVDHLHVAFDGRPEWAYEREGEGQTWASEVCDAFERDAWRAPWFHTIHTAHGDLAKLLAVEWTRERTQDDGSDTIALVCDDDIEYPHDYVWWMVNHLREAEKLTEGKPAIVGLHGIVLPERSPTYRRHRRVLQHCLAPQHAYWDQPRASSLSPVHVLGTSSVVVRRHVLTRFLDDETAWTGVSNVRNALDLHLARWAEREGVPRFVAPLRREGFLKNLLPKDAPSIWSDAETAKEDALVSDVTWGPL